MSIFIDDHAFRCFCLCYGIFTQIKFLLFAVPSSSVVIVSTTSPFWYRSVPSGVTTSSVRCGITSCPCKTFHFVYRLIDHIFAFLSSGYVHTKEYLLFFPQKSYPSGAMFGFSTLTNLIVPSCVAFSSVTSNDTGVPSST